MNHAEFLLPARMRVIVAVVQQTQRLKLRRHKDDHPSFRCSNLWADGSPFRRNLAITIASGNGVTFAFSLSAECTEPPRDSISRGRKEIRD